MFLKRRKKAEVRVLAGESIADYGFGDGHPFGQDRHDVFLRGLREYDLEGRVWIEDPERPANRSELELFHTPRHVGFIERMSQEGIGFLDEGDTPAFPGVYHTAANVVGATLQAGELLATGEATRIFVPIAGLHHAARDKTSGFCVFNDVGVLIEYLRQQHGIRRIAYVDIDAHHGDGVFYGFASDPDLVFADIHEDGRFLFPGTGARDETGIGPGEGAKLNIPLHPGADDEEFFESWREIEAFMEDAKPEFFILVAGADSIAGDPLTHLQFSEEAHGSAARAVCRLADRYAEGRVLGLGGGGYNRRNLACAWSRVVKEFADSV
ncbi:MAG: acetoin utilization protein AcuC [Gammaproteobacteria bacterium]